MAIKFGDRPVVVDYTPAAGEASTYVFTGEDANAQSLLAVGNWLHSTSGSAVVTLRNGVKLHVTLERPYTYLGPEKTTVQERMEDHFQEGWPI